MDTKIQEATLVADAALEVLAEELRKAGFNNYTRSVESYRKVISGFEIISGIVQGRRTQKEIILPHTIKIF
jgi:hypothetical protein